MSYKWCAAFGKMAVNDSSSDDGSSRANGSYAKEPIVFSPVL
jgi:hypothetical protein